MLCRLFVKSSFAIISLGKRVSYFIFFIVFLVSCGCYCSLPSEIVCTINFHSLWVIYCYFCLCLSCNLVCSLSIVVTCWEGANLLGLLEVVFCCVLSLSHVVSRVGCGTELYQFQIFSSLLTLSSWYRGLVCRVWLCDCGIFLYTRLCFVPYASTCN